VVTAVVTESGAVVEIVDDGAGFDAARFTSDRFGIRFSIMHRMSSIAGGTADLDSTPGKGTRVVLRWTRGGQ
jgi:signal transduction histidine kinase